MRTPQPSYFRARADAVSRWKFPGRAIHPGLVTSGSRPLEPVTPADTWQAQGVDPRPNGLTGQPGGGADPVAGPLPDHTVVVADGGPLHLPGGRPAGPRLSLLAPVRPARSGLVRAGDVGLEEPTIALEPPPPASDDCRPDVPALPVQRGLPKKATAQPVRSAGATAPLVSIVIPTYNEAKNLPHVMARIPADVHEVIVVDGRSIDGTVEVARAVRPDVRVVLQNRKGKGNAMACGFAAVTGDIVVMLDADGSADPQEIPLFVAALTAGADFAKGSRFAGDGGSTDITPVRAWGNRSLNRVANLLYGTRFTDLCYGYNAFWRHCLDSLKLDPRPALAGGKLWGDGFEIETIINTRVAKAALAITEVPSFEHPRIYGETNLNTWRDGARVLRALLVERFNGVGRAHRRALRASDAARTVTEAPMAAVMVLRSEDLTA